MAVFTPVSSREVEGFLENYELGTYRSHTGIRQGVENTNFFLETCRGRFVLTLYERRVDRNDLPFFLGLMRHLAANGVPSPLPVIAKNGEVLGELNGKPAAIVTFLLGNSPRRLTVEHCSSIGGALADLHLAASSFDSTRHNALSLGSWRELWRACRETDVQEVRELMEELDAEVHNVISGWPLDLPEGIVHADLFPDNVFFEGRRVSGLIDFYFACSDILAYDLAICLNAWCFEEGAEFNITKARALTSAYHETRPLSKAELKALPMLNRGACLRFLLTRLYDSVHSVDGALVKPKDPREYLLKLRFHRSVQGPSAYGIA